MPEGAADKPMEIWFQDEARVGQKNSLVRQWAAKGSRPRQPGHTGYASAWLFGAVCPERGAGAAIVMPEANTRAMEVHLREISGNVEPGAHAAVVIDGAGWHTAKKLEVPRNISLLLLPPYSPELNPVENIWQYLRQAFLSNQAFPNYEAIIDACCAAWNALMEKPDTIRSIASRKWAKTITA